METNNLRISIGAAVSLLCFLLGCSNSSHQNNSIHDTRLVQTDTSSSVPAATVFPDSNLRQQDRNNQRSERGDTAAYGNWPKP